MLPVNVAVSFGFSFVKALDEFLDIGDGVCATPRFPALLLLSHVGNVWVGVMVRR